MPASVSPGPIPTPGPAWQAVLESIGDDGSVSKETALQAFSVAIGPLPGVTVPAGDAGFVGSGTMAVQWLVRYWDELTSEQQQAAIVMIPELAGLRASEPTVVLASQQRPNDVYTQLAKDMIAGIGGRLQPAVNFGLQVEARVGLPVSAEAWAETSVLSPSYGYKGTPARCVIIVTQTGDALSDIDATLMMAHEAWHCYQGAILGLQRTWFDPPAPWIIEGEAEWVGDSIVPDAPAAQPAWPFYLQQPDGVLFKRSYSAVGFYSQLASSGTDVWSKLEAILKAKGNASAFTDSGADSPAFLDRWASGFLRDSSRGDAWEITGPGITTDRYDPVPIQLANDFTVTESIPAYADELNVFAQHPDVMTVSSGHVRLSDLFGHDYVGGGEYCMLITGCECPNTDQSALPTLDGDSAAFALTAGTSDATAQLDGTSLDDFCTRDVTGTWSGHWANSPDFGSPGASGGFTMALTQKGSSFSGTVDVTGPTCINHGDVSGSVTSGNIQFGWIDSSGGQPDVSFEGTFSRNSMAGTWSAISCAPQSIPIYGSWDATKVGGPSSKP